MLIVGNHPLLPDAKPLKYVSQHLVCGDFADYVGEVEDAFS